MPLLMLALSATVSQQATCRKLMLDFARNEAAFNIIDTMNGRLVESARRFADATQDRSGLEKQERDRRDSAQNFLTAGDRIVALMTGQSCPLPDHVTSPSTFRKETDDCDAARGSPNEGEACSFVERAVDRWMPQRSIAKAPAKRRR